MFHYSNKGEVKPNKKSKFSRLRKTTLEYNTQPDLSTLLKYDAIRNYLTDDSLTNQLKNLFMELEERSPSDDILGSMDGCLTTLFEPEMEPEKMPNPICEKSFDLSKLFTLSA